MNVAVRRVVKKTVRERAQTLYAGVSRDNVSVVILHVKVGGVEYQALGTAKWHKPDIFDQDVGIRRAYDRALVELVDRILDPQRRTLSVRVI